MRARWKPLLWQAVGILCYLAGLLLFFVLAIAVFFPGPGEPPADLRPVHVLVLGLSVLFMVGGYAISYKFGIGQGGLVRGWMGMGRGGAPGQGAQRSPDQSRLQQLGYDVPSESDSEPAPVDFEDGDVYVVCTECGARNDEEFRFCRSCSAELPE